MVVSPTSSLLAHLVHVLESVVVNDVIVVALLEMLSCKVEVLKVVAVVAK